LHEIVDNIDTIVVNKHKEAIKKAMDQEIYTGPKRDNKIKFMTNRAKSQLDGDDLVQNERYGSLGRLGKTDAPRKSLMPIKPMLHGIFRGREPIGKSHARMSTRLKAHHAEAFVNPKFQEKVSHMKLLKFQEHLKYLMQQHNCKTKKDVMNLFDIHTAKDKRSLSSLKQLSGPYEMEAI
jgi:hypothetical protein